MNGTGGLRFAGDAEFFAALRETERVLRETYARAVELCGAAERDGLAGRHGYRGTAEMLRTVLRVSRGETARRLEHARAVFGSVSPSGAAIPAPLPAAGAAAQAGEIGGEHLNVFAKVADVLPADSEHNARVERDLLDAASQLDGRTLHRVGDRVRAHADPDGAEPVDPPVRGNELRWDRTRRRGTFRFDQPTAALFEALLSPLAAPRAATDGAPDPRDHPERQGDALARVVEIAASAPEVPVERFERPHLTVTMGLGDLVAGLPTAILDGQATPLTAGEARRLACDATVIPLVLGGNSEPLDLGRARRTVSHAQRRALNQRDGGCAFPGCALPHRWTEAHHIVPWQHGGVTALDNLVLLCGQHHTTVHHNEWRVRIRDGRPEFTPPEHVDPHRRPRTNTAHHRPGQWSLHCGRRAGPGSQDRGSAISKYSGCGAVPASRK